MLETFIHYTLAGAGVVIGAIGGLVLVWLLVMLCALILLLLVNLVEKFNSN